MSASPLSVLTDSIKDVARTFCDSLCEYVREIEDARRKEIERLEAEALERENAEAAVEAVPFDVLLEKLDAFKDECHSIIRHENAMFWGEDARIFNEKAAARQREILRAIQDENARQAMKRRKLLHNEGSFPEWAR